MSRRVMLGLVQNLMSQSRSICGWLITALVGGSGSSANANVSLFCFGIEVFLGLFGRAAIENKFIFGGVAKIYRHAGN